MASSIYSKPVEEIESFERFVGKTTILGSGYGMGGDKFHGQLITSGAELDLQECKRIISVYRATYSKIPALWRQAQLCIEAMISGSACTLGREGVIRFDADMKGFELPNGLWQRYDTIRQGTNKEGYPEFSYKTRKGQIKLYGGKLIENICQALARCIIAEQMTMIAKKYRVVLTVHDAIGVIAPVAESKEAQTYVEECMRWIPKWATGLPLNCESGIGESYGDC
jgi:DNA polymerase